MADLTYEMLTSLPNAGVTRAVALSWGGPRNGSRDTGGEWLVVERGGRRGPDGADVWADVGSIATTHMSRVAAERSAEQATRAAVARGLLTARYTVVARQAVTITASAAPYGCISGE